jgi:hypothetical protein
LTMNDQPMGAGHCKKLYRSTGERSVKGKFETTKKFRCDHSGDRDNIGRIS